MKKYFEEKKRSLKFKLAGPGHKLSEPSSSNSASTSKADDETPKRVDTKETEEVRSAALAAALQRSQGNAPKRDASLLRLKKQLLKEAEVSTSASNTKVNLDDSCPVKDSEETPVSPGVFFKCPTLDEELVLSRSEWNDKIRAHIFDLKETDNVLGSILQIKSLNLDVAADECISLLIRYLRNIIDNPDNDKYRSVRMGNPKFSEKVLSVEGALDFLLAVGFEKEETNSEPYLKFNRESPSELEVLIHTLLEINGFTLELYRDFRVFEPKEQANISEPLPDDFFEMAAVEIKKQQQERTAQLERESMLVTKKWRESEKAKYARKKALYTRIRVRLPNGFVIQATFSVKEVFQSLRQFIEEHLILDSEYTLMSPPAHVYDENDNGKTFEELNLEPAVQLILKTSSENIIIKTDDNN